MPDKPLAQRLREHVTSRLSGSEPVIKNGAWQMMLDAADEIERLERVLTESLVAQHNTFEAFRDVEIRALTAENRLRNLRIL
ncbi:hypothetical protein ACWX0K_14900 [Nitrobacteraceae bacterium UC4446_H13]